MTMKAPLWLGSPPRWGVGGPLLSVRSQSVPLLALLALLVGGCAVGNKYEYRLPRMPLSVQGGGAIGLAVTDQRPYILGGDKDPDFVGLQRGGYGNPFDVTTASGRPMAEDMAETLKTGLETKGFRVTLLKAAADDPAALGREAASLGLHRVVALQIKEWKTDTMMRTKLVYDLKLFIVDPAGAVVARNAVRGSDTIGGGMPGAIGALAQQAFEDKIGQLFYPPDIEAGLAGAE